MPINPMIALGVRQPEMPSRLNSLAKVMQMRGMQQEQDLGQMKMDEYRRGVSEQGALSELYKTSLGADGKIDRAKLYQGAASGGLGAKIPGLQKGFLETDKAQADVDKETFKIASDRYSAYQRELASLRDDPQLSKDKAMQRGQALLQQGIITSQMYEASVSSLPDDPEQLRSKINQGLRTQLTSEQMLTAFSPKAEKVDNGQQIGFRDTNPNSPTYGQNTAGASVQKLQTPDALMADTRGRDTAKMTDDRARDFNATKNAEVQLKREQKDETAKLTKDSQVASFDTMLGTLDRLSKHPGLTRSVGLTGKFPTMPGSDSANFEAELNTFQSQAFLPMVAQLKGMGALSDAEGKKLTAAVGALDPKMGEVAFRESVARITADMQAARGRMTGTAKAANTGGATGSWDAASTLTVTNPADYAKVPSGATYTTPDGKTRRKP